MSFTPLSHDELAAYFRRTGYKGATTPTLDVLRRLLRAHVLNVSFENLDVQLGHRTTTDPQAAFEKIVHRRRGGWCYEQNGTFALVLSSIGFDVTRIAASVMVQDRGETARANHLTLIVKTADSPGRWLVDVRFGGSLVEPIPFEVGRHKQDPYEVGLERLDDGGWRFVENSGGDDLTFDFRDEPGDERAMTNKCKWLQTDPESSFMLNLVAQRRGTNRHTSLRGRVLKVVTACGYETKVLDNADQLVETLSNIFDLDVPEIADTWPRIAARHDELVESGQLTL